MKTINYMQKILTVYKKETAKMSSKDDIQTRAEMREMFCSNVYRLRNMFPHLLYPLYDKDIIKSEANNIIQEIGNKVKNNFHPIFPIDTKLIDCIEEDIIETPSIVDFKDIPKSNSNILTYDGLYKNVLIGAIMSLPIGKVKLCLADFAGKSLTTSFIEKNISARLLHTPTIDNLEEFESYIDDIYDEMNNRLSEYGDYMDYCNKSKQIPKPYILVCITGDIPESFYTNNIKNLFSNSVKAGIFFVTDKGISDQSSYFWFSNHWITRVNTTNYYCIVKNPIKLESSCYEIMCLQHGYASTENGKLSKYYIDKIKNVCNKKYHSKVELTCHSTRVPTRIAILNSEADAKEFKIALDKYGINVGIKKIFNIAENKTPIIYCTSIFDNNNLLKASLNYINKEASLLKEISNYETDFTTIRVPVGKSNKKVYFLMDMVSHVHSFIIGQSGSGKSVFLHNIIGSAILKYAPEDLQLYLLDFKLGGVEFNRYKGIKHVKSLLVDNSDQQITLEILRELRERMVERGRKLRDCGVNNLVEYNKQNPNETMPQILLVVDECHEMFRVGNDIPRMVSNEISEIITKIAKEGRSQGVHLILATQTLSGTEISNEILNNVSDHYLLKCAPVDSERMVERSSNITSQLSTGQVYYHHVDEQTQFKAFYTNKEEAAILIEQAKEMAVNHKSNGEFYFNGSQLFKLDETVMKQGKERAKYPVAYMGKNISISQNDLSITLRKDYSENILLFGLNDMEQVTRTTMNLFISLIAYTQSKGLDYKFKVFNCLSNEDSIYTEQLEMLEEEGFCEVIESRKDRGKFLKQLAEDISNETAENTIFLILGQERFRELKMDMEIFQEQSKPSEDDAFGFGSFSFSNEGISSSSIKTFKQALELILDKGPEFGVHTVMQLDKPSNFLFSDYISPKMVYQKFKHLIMLKSDEAASAQLHLNDNIRLETLSKDLERLRAYYYSEESDTFTLFTPYMELSNEEIMNLLKTE